MVKRRSRPTRRAPHRPRYQTIADYFARSGDTQVNLARRFATSQAHISRITSGRAVPRPDLALRLAQHCDIPVGSFALAYCARRGLGDTAALTTRQARTTNNQKRTGVAYAPARQPDAADTLRR
jgi:transcriptional regulator with XRE-family HTH domain